MPEYEYKCDHGHLISSIVAVKHHQPIIICSLCGHEAPQVISAPLLVTAQPECRYDSPVTGEVITSWAQRRNDLAKHGCQPYDPGMKEDYHTRLKDSEATLDAQIDEHVERSIEKMPTAQRGKLYNELTRAGADVIVERR